MSTDIIDRISDLPNDMLKEILCLLLSRDVMRMSVLSKIWSEVCFSLPCLNLDLSNHGWRLMKLTDDASLENFVSAVLRHYDTTRLHMFRLICQHKYLDNFIPSFLTEAIKFNPRIVYLDIPISYTNNAFSSIFTCKSVEELNLICQSRYRILVKPEVVTLLSLKKLCLTDVMISGESFGKLLSGCPVIEDISLKNCSMIGTSSIISNTTLKSLTLERCIYFHLSICAPNLVSLEYTNMGNKTTLMNLSSLVFARVSYNYFGCGTIITGLSSVRHLDLCGRQMKAVLDRELTTLPRFHNLKSLSLNGWCMACHSDQVAWFLENSPNLEKLTVCLNRQHCLVKNKRNHCNLRQIEAPRCKKLKELVVRVSEGYKRAYGLGMAFLKVVKEIEIAEIVLCNRVWIRNGFFKNCEGNKECRDCAMQSNSNGEGLTAKTRNLYK